jgi:hypothetical protein
MHPDLDVLERGHVLEEADVLERPAQPGDDHVVGPGALEHAEPDQQLLVPRRPRHADEHPAHQREDRQRDADDDRCRCRGLEAQDDREQGNDPGRQDPHDRLQPSSPRVGDHPPAAELDHAAGRVVDAGNDVEERRLAGTVRTDQAHDRVLGDREVDAAHGDEAAEALGDVRGAQQVGHG